MLCSVLKLKYLNAAEELESINKRCKTLVRAETYKKPFAMPSKSTAHSLGFSGS